MNFKGMKSLSINGVALKKLFINGVLAWGGEPFNQALDLVGYSASSLEEVLASSEMCSALAGNTEAVSIMKENYSAEMTAAIDSGWNDGLNTLNYAAKLKCYLLKNSNQCSAITGGWTVEWDVVLAGAPMYGEIGELGIYMAFRRTNGDGLYRDNCIAKTKKSISMNGYDTINWNVTTLSAVGRKQMQYGSSNYSDGITSTGTHSYTAKDGTQAFYWSNVPHQNVGTQVCRVSDVYLIPE